MSIDHAQECLYSAQLSPAARVAQGEMPPNWFSVKEQPAYTPRKIKIICAGAGFSGLTLAHKIKHELRLAEFIDYTVYDKNTEVGGVWIENRYPGVACSPDAYTFRFEPNPYWSHFYVSGPEISEYIHNTVRKWGLDEHVELNSNVIESVWDEDLGKWRVKIEQDSKIKEDEADIFVNASGILNNWKLPDIQGLTNFRGKLVHTADWDDKYEWKNKRVAIIGNGASGIQCVAAMHSKVSRLVNYVRNPTWITPNINAEMTKTGNNFAYTPEEQEKFKNDPKAFFEFRKEVENHVNGGAYATLKDHPLQHWLRGETLKQMQEKLKLLDPSIASRIIPDFAPGCRRLTPGSGYLEAFSAENTEMCWEDIERVTETGIRTADGKEKEFDLIVCATGFNTSIIPRWKQIGKNGVDLREHWKNDPEAFFSVHVDQMPNYFMIGGPNFPVSHGTVTTGFAIVCDYILKWAMKIATEDIKSIDVRKESLDDYNVWTQEYLKRTAFSGECRSWYKNGKSSGLITGTYAGTTSHFQRSLERMGGEHFHIRYNSVNRFSCLGNGQMEEEKNGDGELANYFVQGIWGP
ncbi:hypothetical protein PENANT_c002G04512 [Penicillium antarcticum]|uniref:FAD/NAD(P)-binding domain-containing protein n=1 Tax=Penicillium antarcticum TaxID=416450 RepID=A0A1V6QKP0_9EURO|nr:hypothetical protein PENANT_c002G04512 [Penicillium antarcticum]